jgi:hypothetical protein
MVHHGRLHEWFDVLDLEGVCTFPFGEFPVKKCERPCGERGPRRAQFRLVDSGAGGGAFVTMERRVDGSVLTTICPIWSYRHDKPIQYAQTHIVYNTIWNPLILANHNIIMPYRDILA